MLLVSKVLSIGENINTLGAPIETSGHSYFFQLIIPELRNGNVPDSIRHERKDQREEHRFFARDVCTRVYKQTDLEYLRTSFKRAKL